MRKIFIFILLNIITSMIYGQSSSSDNRWKLAVYITGDASQSIKNITQNKVATALTNSGKYQLIERSAEFLKAITSEQTYQNSGEVDDKQITTLGVKYGAKYVCVVNTILIASENYMQVAMRMIDVERAVSELAGEAESSSYKGPGDISEVVDKAVAQMLGGGAKLSNAGNYSTNSSNSSSSGQNITFTLPSGQSFKMIYVQGGTFTMGCTSEQSGCGADESPAHNVTLDGYYIAEFELTQALWKAVMGTSISQQRDKANQKYTSITLSLYGTGDNYPMYYISYNECEEFCGRLNNLLRNDLPAGFKFRLPTEAQWEYAARGGVKDKSTMYAGSDYIYEVACYKDNSSESTKEVGLKDANELGIYDMSGNVWEWCMDWYSESYYASSPSQNPKNMSSGSSRVIRGGSWYNTASYSRVSYRSNYAPSNRDYSVGFRLALVQ